MQLSGRVVSYFEGNEASRTPALLEALRAGQRVVLVTEGHGPAERMVEVLRGEDIAARLVISPRTAESHVEQILTRLGFRSRAQIAAWTAGRR